MQKYLALFIVICSLALLSACSSKQDIEGEVFIENGGVGTKLTLVEIQVVPEAQFLAYIKQQLPKIEQETKKIEGDIALLEAGNTSLRANIDDIFVKQMAVASMGGMSVMNGTNPLINSSNETVAMAKAQVEKTNTSIYELKTNINGLTTGTNGKFFYSPTISGATQKVSTNADGKFKLSVERGAKVALVASKDNFFWYLWITPDKNTTVLTLSNKNLNGMECPECIFNRTVTPKVL